MIVGFEELTQPLTVREKMIEPLIKHLLISYLSDKTKPISQAQLCRIINNELNGQYNGNIPVKFDPRTLRRFIHYFRAHGHIPIIATAKGCYISYNDAEIEQQINSLKQRAENILIAARGLEYFLTINF